MGFNTPLQQRCRIQVELSVGRADVVHYICGTDCDVMLGGMMFCGVISKIGLAGFPVDMKLLLANAIA